MLRHSGAKLGQDGDLGAGVEWEKNNLSLIRSKFNSI